MRAIRWFERHAPQDFALYGYGWDKLPRLPTRLGGLVHRIEGALPLRPRWFPSWRGVAASKHEVLRRARFSICYENVGGLRGYITEKIFDAFCAGNVPVYWGAEDIADYVPETCFIDRRRFRSYDDLHAYLVSMPEDTFFGYQKAIRDFLASPKAQRFSTRTFAETIVAGVLSRL
ncbi:glycosyltransferase family 10 domain-containing protein [Thiobacter aerophilum]|uniref:Glycosyltransferase family 10 n=1 Tax=Thiobacter aerophilum TaxID=3121275 RepID=A0ABV0EFC9_9BURK